MRYATADYKGNIRDMIKVSCTRKESLLLVAFYSTFVVMHVALASICNEPSSWSYSDVQQKDHKVSATDRTKAATK